MKTAEIIKMMKEERQKLVNQVTKCEEQIAFYDEILDKAEKGDQDDNGTE